MEHVCVFNAKRVENFLTLCRALYDDSCLFVVPKTHNQPRTIEQRALSSTLDPPRDPLEMPGVKQVHLKGNHYKISVVVSQNSSSGTRYPAGETVFYNSNILHCATYDCRLPRITLHACMGDTRGGSTRARNVLQHGLEWMKENRFVETLPEGRAKDMWEKLIELEKGTGGKIEYSLEG